MRRHRVPLKVRLCRRRARARGLSTRDSALEKRQALSRVSLSLSLSHVCAGSPLRERERGPVPFSYASFAFKRHTSKHAYAGKTRPKYSAQAVTVFGHRLEPAQPATVREKQQQQRRLAKKAKEAKEVQRERPAAGDQFAVRDAAHAGPANANAAACEGAAVPEEGAALHASPQTPTNQSAGTPQCSRTGASPTASSPNSLEKKKDQALSL